jgi:hypothetical protein
VSVYIPQSFAALRMEGFSDAEATAHWMASHAGER